MMTKEAVILLHGLGRTRYSLRKLEASLSDNYHVINLGYPSRQHSIEVLANMAIAPALALAENASKIHFVTHSMGGILVRQYLTTQKINKLGNTVMLGPPNNGSELVDFFLENPLLKQLFKTLNGPAGTQLGIADSATPKILGKANFNTGIISGSQSTNPFFNRIIDGPHDGKVSVASSKLKGMCDHIILPVNHTFMMQNHSVINQVQHFLRFTRFDHG